MKWTKLTQAEDYMSEIGPFNILISLNEWNRCIRIYTESLYYDDYQDPNHTYPQYATTTLYQAKLDENVALNIAKLQAKSALRLILQGIEFELNSSAE